MSTFITLFKKEWLEAWRDKKLIWLPVVLCLLAVSQPISTYFMPEILEMAGNLPEGAVIDIPVPSGEEVLAGTLSQFGMIGTAIFVLSAMGVVSNERNSGSLSLLMARPVDPFIFIASKWAAQALIFLLSFALSYGLAYYYTNLLFNQVDIQRFISSFGVYSLWILFTLSITLLLGTIMKKNGGIAGMSIMTVAGLSIIGSLFPKFMGWSPSNAQNQAGSMLMSGKWEDSFGLMLSVSIALIVGLVIFTSFAFKKYESY
ncbi:ABC transporter permease [Siminovitchia acidinfaciens]|uniref:ABC transporter permease n=1 Tax=Siminovitchia acidinfaciens TaxID=2321395 RepID=A0A429Y4X7_9BACI|nr:ABC transporter permease subunit [Siminovitchia acidinfaciens]RST76427.1 ABC transporter permease [Siminovitchia acidinfaciens]VEF47258.1 putative ABC-transporter permease [Bacillus freudenreichii]